MRLVAMSDTHSLHSQIVVPDGDVVVHAGDYTGVGSLREQEEFLNWFCGLPHKYKVLIAGNHDICATTEEGREGLYSRDICYLEDSLVEIDGLTFYGSPWTHTPEWGVPGTKWWNFSYVRGDAGLAVRRKLIPDGVDVLVTHSPPQGHLDGNHSGEACGCTPLLNRILEVRPEVHVFGHIHESYGMMTFDRTTFVNASIRDHIHRTLNPVQVLDI